MRPGFDRGQSSMTAPITYCTNCLEPNTRPDSNFEDDGRCLACHIAANTGEINWPARHKELEEIAIWGKENCATSYDCLIPVSGGKDSLRQSLYCRDELGLNPLLVTCAYPPQEQTDRGAANMGNLIELGFDCIYVSPGPDTWRRLMRAGFDIWGNLNKSTELPLYATAPRVATAYHIPLVVYGENPALSWGGSGGSFDGDANRLKYSNTLNGGDISWILDAGFDPGSLYWYTYPPDDDIHRANLRMIYLGYYISDFNDEVNASIAIDNGLTCRQGDDADPMQIGQITDFDALDCDFIAVNQMLKAMKFGFGKVSEQCSGFIRAGLMTRDEAIELTRLYDAKCDDRFVHKVCDFIGMTYDEFWEVAERWRNHDLWVQDGNDWRMKYPPE